MGRKQKRSKSNKFNVKESVAYSNCLMLSPSGVKLARVSRHKAEWYINKGLASLVSDDPYWVLKLNFEPAAIIDAEDPYLIGIKYNICVVCSAEEDLTLHHVVPYCYRKHFPDGLKRHSHFDVLLLCSDCHERYEIEAGRFKKRIFEDLNIDTTIPRHKDADKLRACAFAISLKRLGENIPDFKQEEMKAFIKTSFSLDEEVTEECLNKIINEKHLYHFRPSLEQCFKKVVERYELNEFCLMWRRHFVNTLKPKYMPEFWDINRTIYRGR